MKVWKKLQSLTKSKLKSLLLGSVSIKDLPVSLKADYHYYPTLSESIQTEEAVNMRFLPDATVLQKEEYHTPDIFTVTLKKVYYCPKYNILHTKDRRIIEESISTQRELSQFSARDFYGKKSQVLFAPCTSFRSHKNCYYHTIVDNLPRLYLLNNSQFSNIPSIDVLCGYPPTSVESFYLKKLLPDNAKIKVVKSEELYLVENFIFPSFISRRFSGYLPPQYLKWFLERTLPSRPRNKRHRIFISRIPTHKGKQRCILNEDELFNALETRGFKRYVLETMPIEAQIDLFYDAEYVVAAHGAGLTNLIFSSGAAVCELFPMPYVVPHYYYLSRALNHRHIYLCGQERKKSSNFTVDVSKVLRRLDRLRASDS